MQQPFRLKITVSLLTQFILTIPLTGLSIFVLIQVFEGVKGALFGLFFIGLIILGLTQDALERQAT